VPRGCVPRRTAALWQHRPEITHRDAGLSNSDIGGSIDGENGAKISDTDSGTRRHFNGMTGAQLKQLREDLGEAIGRPLTVKDFAKLCGLPPESGGGTILEWEHGYGPIGPVAALLSLLSVASDRYPIDEEIISEHDAAFYRAMMRAGIIRRLG
jgi:hypothetical protein